MIIAALVLLILGVLALLGAIVLVGFKWLFIAAAVCLVIGLLLGWRGRTPV